MILRHLREFFSDKKNIITALSLMGISSITTAAIYKGINSHMCKIDKQAIVYFKNQDIKQGTLESINTERLVLKEETENELKNQEYTLDIIKKIIFFSDEESYKDEIISGNNNKKQNRYVGKYKFIAGGHEGFLTIYNTESGFIGGYIQFPHWGKGKIEYLTYLEIQGNTIKFSRSCSKTSCIEIGSPYEFKQNYTGSFNEKGELEGKYTGTHSSGNWKAIRLQ